MHLTRYHSSSLSIFFFFNDAATSEFYTLSLHDALPILRKKARTLGQHINRSGNWRVTLGPSETRGERSEEHTSELQSRFDLVCRLLPEKKKNTVNGPEIAHSVSLQGRAGGRGRVPPIQR